MEVQEYLGTNMAMHNIVLYDVNVLGLNKFNK
jgi:hypothetical protein